MTDTKNNSPPEMLKLSCNFSGNFTGSLQRNFDDRKFF